MLTVARLDLAEGKASGTTPSLQLELTDVQVLVEKVATGLGQSYPGRILMPGNTPIRAP